MGGLTTKQIDNQVRECVWEFAQSMSIIRKQGASLKQWNLLLDYCITGISNMASKLPLWKWYMAHKTNLDCQQLKAALDKFGEDDLHRRNNRLEQTLTKKSKLMYVGMYFMIPMLLLLFLMMCRYRRQLGRNLRSQVLADKGALRHFDRFCCQDI